MKKLLFFSLLAVLAGCSGTKNASPTSGLEKAKALLEEEYQLVKRYQAGELTYEQYLPRQVALSEKLTAHEATMTYAELDEFRPLYRRFSKERLDMVVDQRQKEKDKATQRE